MRRGSTVLVAISGGPDSMALLHVLAKLRESLGFGLFGHGVDHGLRPESSAELDGAAEFARGLDVPFSRTRVAIEPGGNLQARARSARWNALTAAAERNFADCIATGHHADDRAETVVMRLLRSGRLRSLAVLAPKSGLRVRPMIYARRRDIAAHIARHNIPCVIDPSNSDPRFLRTRVRSEVLPALERISPRIVEHLCALADDAAGMARR